MKTKFDLKPLPKRLSPFYVQKILKMYLCRSTHESLGRDLKAHTI